MSCDKDCRRAAGRQAHCGACHRHDLAAVDAHGEFAYLNFPTVAAAVMA